MSRDTFYHPYEPYEIQREFMTALYQCIEEGKIGIFESPTGKHWQDALTEAILKHIS